MLGPDGHPERAPLPFGVDASAGSSLAITAARSVAVLCAYYAAASLGLLMPYVGSHISLIWLPTAVGDWPATRMLPA